MRIELSAPELAAYYAGRKHAASGRAYAAAVPYRSPAERKAFAAGFRHWREEDESRRLLDECRQLPYAALFDQKSQGVGYRG